MTFTVFDLVVIAVVLVSTLIAFARGFVREVLSVSAFIAAAVASLAASPLIAPSVRGLVQPDWVALFIVVVGIFMAVFVGVTMVTHSLSKMFNQGGEVGIFDRVLGLGFGAGRGVLLLALVLVIYQATVKDSQPSWVVNAFSYKYINGAGNVIEGFADEGARVSTRPVEQANGG